MGKWKNPEAIARQRDITAARNRRAISYAVRIGNGTASVASIAREEGVTHSAIGLILQRACPPFVEPPPPPESVKNIPQNIPDPFQTASNEAAKSDMTPKPEIRPDWTRPDPALLALAREARADIEREWGKTRIAKPPDDAWTDHMLAASQPEEP